MEKKKEQIKGKLIATRPILYEGREFKTGEELPRYDADMVDAWMRHGSAKILAEKQEAPDGQMPEEEGQEPAEDQMPEEEEQEVPEDQTPEEEKQEKKKTAGRGRGRQ